MPTTSRSDAVAQLMDAGRRHSTGVVLFHAALAAQSGLTATESKVLEIIERRGPITHADLVGQTGLAPASVTGILTRLENKGAARRLTHPTDARRVLIETVPAFTTAALQRFQGFIDGMTAITADYNDEELATITRFLNTVATMQTNEAATLRATPSDDGT